uniref:tyrosine--tRNA ligase n=1 Tax=Albugo laibachii Nc14 TaxID=890382 RepID=F0W4M3_9STRA|nr:ATP binding protein putative [Albugo laibachii Nc14]|eukprot:CCA16057.1 ATP binding protein putative [Albugo laibachii Nc14]
MTTKPRPPMTSNDPSVAQFSTLQLQVSSSLQSDCKSTRTLSLDQILEELSTIKGPAGFSIDEENQLRDLFTKTPHPIAYDGFEPTGRFTLASGLLRVINAKRLMKAGCHVRFWIGDAFAMLNNKFGGDLNKGQIISQYMVQVWKALGLDSTTQENFEFLLSSSEIARHADKYWSRVLDIAGQFSVERIQKCATMMGRDVDEPVCNANRILYPLMQCADSFLLEADICQFGADQEEACRLNKEYIAKLEDRGDTTQKKPFFLLHPLLKGLKQDQFKMSTTDPESAIYVDDTIAEVNSKIKRAFCPPGQIDQNPILDYMKYVVFPMFVDEGIVLERNEKNGGNRSFKSFKELENAFSEQVIHPADLKPCLSKYINSMLDPVRQHFATGDLKKLWNNVKKLKISSTPDGDKLVSLTIPAFPDTERRQWKVSELTLDEKYERSRSVGQECTLEEELRALLSKKDHFVCYDGFEPSGRMHIAQGILRSVNVNRLTDSGAIFRFWVADWFALLNNKMGGDLEKIRIVGRYMIEIWKSTGMDMTNVQFLWASDQIIANGASYWLRVMDIARRTTIARTVKCCTIMGRKEKEGMLAAQILYPLMQCADIFFLKADVCQLGLDQRKINMLARDYCDLVKIKFKPVILSHHMLMGLKEGQEKMSKSNPESAIFMEDTPEHVDRKISNAFCPAKQTEGNPILDYMKNIIFPKLNNEKPVQVGELSFHTYIDLESAYSNGLVDPDSLKRSVTQYLNEMLEPVRKHFAQGEAKDLLEKVRSYRVTR